MPNTTARVRMYRQGLGDCFLLTFTHGSESAHILIDCGTLGCRATNVSLKDVADDILSATRGRLDCLIGTHEHKDHLSGFVTKPSRDVFDKIDVEHVWAAWTEDPDDELAQEVAKYTDDLMTAVSAVALLRADDRIGQLLEFYGDLSGPFGAFAKTVNEGMNYVLGRAPDGPAYLNPGDVLEPDWLPGVRVYVLGPPRSRASLAALGEHGSPDLYHLARGTASGLTFAASIAASKEMHGALPRSPLNDGQEGTSRQHVFDPRFRIDLSDDDRAEQAYPGYFATEGEWRRCDNDWQNAATDLAMQLDSLTNNTSLALAFELIDSGKVLLFPGDAQLGNWLGWYEHTWTVPDGDDERDVTVVDLLKRAVLYKVSHHASHNGTRRPQGLEIMKRKDLTALIPLDKKVSDKKKGWVMPLPGLYMRLLQRTKGRVLRSDTGWPDIADCPADVSASDLARARGTKGITVGQLYIDVEVR